AYQAPDRLVFIREVVAELRAVYPTLPVNIQHFRFWRDHDRSCERMAAFVSGSTTLTGGGKPEVLDIAEVTSGLFSVLGVQPRAGRSFLAGEEQPGRNRVVLITDRLWHRRFGASPAVGATLLLDGVPHTVVGILPPSFRFPHRDDLGPLARLGDRVDLFRPLGETEEGWGGDYDFSVIARLRPGVTLPRARVELDLLEARIDKEHQLGQGLRVTVRKLQDAMTAPVRAGLYALLCGVGLLLLIVCVNLANLVLARCSVRARELAIRAAIGASRASLEREVMIETLMLSALGGLLGVIAARAALAAFVAAAPVDLPRLDEVSIDSWALAFAFGLAVACGLLSGLLPARRIAAADPQGVLRAESLALSESRRALRLREVLVGCEVGLSSLLLVLAGLLVSSLVHLLRVDKGFLVERAVAVTLQVPHLHSKPERTRFFERTLEQLRALAGVRSAAYVSKLPLTGESNVNQVQLEGADQGAALDPTSMTQIEINVRFVSAQYFATLGIPLLRGRDFEPGDADHAVALVSARLAAKLWPGRDPIGRKFSTGSGVGKVAVIGVVKDVHGSRLEQGTTLMAYVPYWRRGLAYGSVVVRTALPPAAIERAVASRIRAADPDVAVPAMRTMSELVSDAVSQRRFQMRLAAGFALSALLLAALGIFGVVSYGVSQRRTEIGIRMALGGQMAHVVRLVLGGGLRPVFLGLAAGLAAAIPCGRLVQSLLFGITAADPLTMLGVALLLTAVSAAACLAPALDAARTDAAVVLRAG
ncbi:MAG TPA: ADOP family duplicated permease, partial [Thermoanaerobaculia bacterium]|nr:ADOP family duplicated permease [Thermoanaerobaculia bacterium]